MMGGLVTSTIFTLLVLPSFYLRLHEWLARDRTDGGDGAPSSLGSQGFRGVDPGGATRRQIASEEDGNREQ
jgi:hypothetical protein